jgi:hypothetical protein
MISAGGLLYLGADAFVPPHGRLSLGLDVPCRDVSVDLKTAAGTLVAAAFWALREAGAVTIGVEQKKGLFGAKSRVAVRRAPGGTGAGANGPVETGLLAALADKDPYARDTVYRWLGRDFGNPWGTAVGRIESELVEAGLLKPAEVSGVKGKLKAVSSGRPAVAPDCGAVDAVRVDVEAMVGQWQAFQHAEPDLAKALVAECRDGVDRRLESD